MEERNDVYKFETESRREMDLVVNRHKLILALYEFLEWYRALYNGRDYDTQYVCNGKIYTQRELHEDKEIPRDEHGMIVGGCTEIYTTDQLLHKLDSLLDDVRDIIARDME